MLELAADTPELGAPDIVGVKEACDILGVASGNLMGIAGMRDLPCTQLACGKTWWRTDIADIAEDLNEKRAQRAL